MTKSVTENDLNEIRDDVETKMTNHTTEEEKSSLDGDMIVLPNSVHIFTNNWGGYETAKPNDDDSIPFGSLFMDDGILFSAIACNSNGENKCFQFNRATGEMNVGTVDDELIITLIMAPQDTLKNGVVRRIYHSQGDGE